MRKWQHPFPKTTITSVFGDNKPPRTSPHRGVDYAPKAKSIIPAVTDGVITRIFYSKCLGWVCELQSDEDNIFFGHSHLYCNKHDSINCDGSDHKEDMTCMKNLKVGDRVVMGQPIGRIGDSGDCSRGAHLHLTASKSTDPRYAKTFDPVKFLDQKIARDDDLIAQAEKEAQKAKEEAEQIQQKPEKEPDPQTEPEKPLPEATGGSQEPEAIKPIEKPIEEPKMSLWDILAKFIQLFMGKR